MIAYVIILNLDNLNTTRKKREILVGISSSENNVVLSPLTYFNHSFIHKCKYVFVCVDLHTLYKWSFINILSIVMGLILFLIFYLFI